MPRPCERDKAFTLIELSIVLVILGLLIGGILVGRDLINAAAIRAQISQIQKYQAAVNTFRMKYSYLPGDAPQAIVNQFVFTAAPSRPGTQSQGDGNGIVEGYNYRDSFLHLYIQSGENLWFWEDLSTNSNLIDERFYTATNAQLTGCISVKACEIYIPTAKIGNGNTIYVYPNNNLNYFALARNSSIDNAGANNSGDGLRVIQAYSIDLKIDDGQPLNGQVLAQYSTYPSWLTLSSNAAAPSLTTCYDTTSNQYSITQSNGTGVNCALSFKFQ